MTLDADAVKHIANLARLEVTADELDNLTGNLSRIIEFVEQLDESDTTGVSPMAHPLNMTQRLRPDEVNESNQREQFQACAPSVEGGLYLVPKVIE